MSPSPSMSGWPRRSSSAATGSAAIGSIRLRPSRCSTPRPARDRSGAADRSVRSARWLIAEITSSPGWLDAAMSQAAAILAGLGGAGNIVEIEACITRLRTELEDVSLVDEAVAAGRRRARRDARGRGGPGGRSAPRPTPRDEIEDLLCGPALMRVVAPVTGTSREVSDVPDPVFASGMVGPGAGDRPGGVGADRGGADRADGWPSCTRTPSSWSATTGPGVLVHLGIDTVHDARRRVHPARRRGRPVVQAGSDDRHLGPGVRRGPAAPPMCAVVVLDCPARAEPGAPSSAPRSRPANRSSTSPADRGPRPPRTAYREPARAMTAPRKGDPMTDHDQLGRATRLRAAPS